MKKKLSRQRIWQLNKVKEGLCAYCGKLPIYKASSCKKHYEKSRKCTKKWRDINREYHLKYMKKWRIKNPNYINYKKK